METPARGVPSPAPTTEAKESKKPPPPKITTLLLDCDNTLTLTEEHAFAATAQTINTILSDFKVPRQPQHNNSNFLTESALQAHESETSPTKTTSPQPSSSSSSPPPHLPTSAHHHHHPSPDEHITTTTTTTFSPDPDPDSSPYASYTTASLLSDYIGLPFRQILTSILTRHSLILTPSQTTHYHHLEEHNINTQITLHSPAAPQILPTLLRIRALGTFTKIAVVSSSPLPRIQTALRKAHLYPAIFTQADLFSASDSLSEPTHKPHPAIYIHTLSALNVNASECLAVEDSVSGTLAAVRAGIRCLGFVGAYHDPMKRDVMARVLMGKGAGAVMGAWDEFEALLPRLQVLELPVPVDVADAVGGVEGVSLGREVLRDE